MTISKTVNFLPEYFRTIPNARFLDSTLDRLFSAPQLERFDGFVGRQIDPNTGQVLSGPYIQEDTAVRQNYQLEANFVTTDVNNNIQNVVGWQDLLNAIANKSGITDKWNRLLTGNMYSWKGFVDIDKIINYQNYYWVPQQNESSAWFWNNSVQVNNSNIGLNETYTITRGQNDLKVSSFNIPNPEISLVRGGTYNFNITQDTTSPKTRIAHTIENLSADTVTYVTADINNPYFNNTTGNFSFGSSLEISPVTDLVLAGSPFTIETFLNLSADGPGIIAGITNNNNQIDSWQLLQNDDNTLTFSWIDSTSGQVYNLNTPSALSLNEWYFVSITRSAGTIRLYINGFLVNSTNYNGVISQPNNPLYLGSFTGFLSNFRISINIARYTADSFVVPQNSLVNDIYTSLLIGFDTDPNSTVFVDDNNVVLSKIWIQNNPGVQGTQTYNPSISATNIDGVQNNGITNGIITFTVPTVEANQQYINLNFHSDNRDYVDLATSLNFNQINGQPLAQFITIPGLGENSNVTGHWGGIDGITDLIGKTLIFANNQQNGWGNTPSNEWTDIWQIGVDVNNNITLTYYESFDDDYRLLITNGAQNRLTSLYKQNGIIYPFPSAANLYSHFYLQDNSDPSRVLKLNILNENYLPQLNVETDILGKLYYISGNGVEFRNGLKITFGGSTIPALYNTTASWIVEGVGTGIVLVPVSDLIIPESIVLQNNPPDYITINRASLDRNGWALTNQWIHKNTFNEMINILSNQGIVFPTMPVADIAVRPIIEFNAGLKLFGFGNIALQPVKYLDQYTLDAFSNVQGRISYQVDGQQVNNGDTVVFNADKNSAVRATTYMINFSDPTGKLEQPINRLHPVQAATIGNISLTGLLVIDGYQTQVGDRILVWQQTNSTQNGIYEVTNGQWVRTADANTTVSFQNYFGVLSLNGQTYANSYFNYNLNANTNIGTTPILFMISTTLPIITLQAVQTATNGSGILVLSGASFTEQNLVWNSTTTSWDFSAQNKTSLQQYPLFDLFDNQGNSFSNATIYPETTFNGSLLFTFAVGNGSIDSVLGIKLDYGLIGNLNDIIFENNFDNDTFSYSSVTNTNSVIPVSLSEGVAQVINPLAATISYYNPWQYINSKLELYQNLTFTGLNYITIPATLLVKNQSNSQPNKVFVNGEQLSFGQYTLIQSNVNGVPTVIINIDPTLISANSIVYVKLIASSVIPNAYYDVPPSFDQNPFGQNFDTFSMSDLRTHATASYSNIDKNIAVQSTNFPVDLQNVKFNGVPGSLLYNETLSILPTLLLTNTTFDIDQALKAAGEDYLLFKQKFLNVAQQITNIQNLTAKQAVDKIMNQLNLSNTSTQPWFTSDMVAVGGSVTTYTVMTSQQVMYNIKNVYDFMQPSSVAIFVYLNNKQLVFGQDYVTVNSKPILNVLKSLNISDSLTIYEVSNTDGCYVPTTPSKLGLAPAYIPSIYLNSSYITPQTVIQGHDGSITIAYGDYRDNLLLELELRIYNNLKVNNQLWTDVIETNVPTAGRWRNEQALENTEISPYSNIEQLDIYQRLFYEWVATYHVKYTNNYYDATNEFTWNYSNCLDMFNEMDGQSNLPGYWKGIFNYFYDTINPGSRPWESLNITIKPTWWDNVYGPAPYTGQNLLWSDIKNGIVRNPNGITKSSYGTRIISEGSVSDVLPVDDSGIVLSPNDCVVGMFNDTNINASFVFGDDGPAEASWRQSSIYPFAKLRAQIIQNPLFMCGMLWDLNNYLPTAGWNQFKYENTQFGSLSDVLLNSISSVANSTATVRVNSILNYSVEFLRRQGLNPSTLSTALASTQVNLVYDMAGFASPDDIVIFADQNNPADQGSSVQLPQEDFSLYLSENVPTGVLSYSGVIIAQTPQGYTVNGYDQSNPFFVILPSISGPYNTIAVGNSVFKIYQNYSTTPQYIPYNYVLPDQQSVVNFLSCYGQYLTSIGLQFDPNPAEERISWSDACLQFIKWSLENWSFSPGNNPQTMSLVLNPAASILEFNATNGTLQSLTDPSNILFDINQTIISQKYLDVYRTGNTTRITHQGGGVLAGLRANIIAFEHRLVIQNTTVFDDIIYVPNTGLRQNRLRIVGQKTANWNGTLDAPGFLIVTNQVQTWAPNTDYLKGTVVSFKNTNYVATVNIIGSTSFQYTQFTVITTQFTNTILPNLSLKATDLTHAYDSEYRNYITDFIRLRSNTIGYIERDWLSGLGIDLASQTDFYRGWIKEKGSLNAINAYGRGSTNNFNTQLDIFQEYAFRVGDYGATARTGYGDVQLTPSVNISNPLVITFVSEIDSTDAQNIQVTPFGLYEKSSNWINDFVQPQGTIKANQTNFINAGPVLPDTIIARAVNTVPYFNELDQTALFAANISAFVGSDLQENILKIAENNGIFWIENDSTVSAPNNWNIIKFNQANAYVQSINQVSNNTVSFNLTSDIGAVINSVVIIDHVDANTNVIIQGSFIVNNYAVAPTNASISTLTVSTTNSEFTFNTITYNPPFSEKTIFTEQSLRSNSIGQANIALTNTLGLPTETLTFVDNNSTGSASYEYFEPYANELIQDLVPGQSPNFGVAYDATADLLWVSKPGALDNAGRIELYSIFNEINTANVITPTLNLSSIQEITSQRNDSFGLGDVLVSLSNGLVAAHSNQAANGPGLVYICQASTFNNSLTVNVQATQILCADGWPSNSGNIGFGTTMSASSDGNWLYISAPNLSGVGQVSAYMAQYATATTYTATTVVNNAITLTGNVQPYNAYSLQIIVIDPINNFNNQLLCPTRDYTVNGYVVTFNVSISASASFRIAQLAHFFDYVGNITNTSLSSGSGFGSSISCDAAGITLIVGSPLLNNGRVDIYQRIVENTYSSQPISVITPFATLPSNGKIKLIINGKVIQNNEYEIVGNTLVLNTQTIPDSTIQVQVNTFSLLQTITAPNVSDRLFGSSIALNNSQLIIGAPNSTLSNNSVTTIQKGHAYFYYLDTSAEATKTISVSSLTLTTGQELLINNWALVLSGTTINQVVTYVNNLTMYTGITATVSINGQNIIFSINPSLHTTGIRTNFGQSINSRYVLNNTIESNDVFEYNVGMTIKWLSTDLFGIVSNYSPEYVTSQLDTFYDGTLFDANNTLFFDGIEQPTQRLTLYQVLTTDYSWVNQNVDIIQTVPIKIIQISGSEGASTIYDGDINNLWIGNAGTSEDPINLYNNPTLVHGWTATLQESTPLEARSIGQAWLYDSLTNIKLVDLEVVDLATGLLPGSVAQELDYVSDIDPAIYGYPQWTSGTKYIIGSRVMYNNQLWQSLMEGRSGIIFNPNFWTLIIPDSNFANNGPVKWGKDQVGKTWFNTNGLKVVNAQLGTVSQRAQDWNQWFPNSNIEIYQWVISKIPPAQYPNSSTNGFVVDINCPYIFDANSGFYGFWVTGLEVIGPVHSMAITDIASSLTDVTNTGVPMITPIANNAVAVWNINQYVANDNAILHIDYVTESSNNSLHSEFILLSNNGEKTWLTTPLYNKFVDSFVGQTATNQLVPDITLSQNQQYGIEVNPQQTIFVDRVTAILIYYQVINQNLANIAVNSTSVTSLLQGTSPIPTSGYNQTVPTRNILLSLNNNLLPQNYRVLVQSDYLMRNNGWSVVANINGSWQFVQMQTYDVQSMWEPEDWYASNYVDTPPTYTLNNIGELPSIQLQVGITIGILNNGDGGYAVYDVVTNDIDATKLELSPIYIQNGTIQFLPQLYDFNESGIGFDESPFDSVRYWDDDPYTELRLITQVLNQSILVGNFSQIADDAFFAMLNYIIYENKNLDWLFKTSFISVNYPTSNLNVQSSYMAGNAQIVQNFVTETLPYHTRIRQFNDIYTANEYGNIVIADFDLPAQYDTAYANIIASTPNNVKTTELLQLKQFRNNVGVASDRTRFYINSSGIPDYPINSNGFIASEEILTQNADNLLSEEAMMMLTEEFDNNIPIPQNWVFSIRSGGLQNNSVSYAIATNNVSPIAVAINGLPFFSPNSGQTETLYLDSNLQVNDTYTINTVYADIQNNIDPGIGYANVGGVFQILTDPTMLYTKTANVHSPIIGYAFDGNPIYGPYGYANVDGTGGIILNTSSYQLSTNIRLDKVNEPIVNGLQLADFSAPTGQYIEDFEYVQNLGTLDMHNGRFCITPEYPLGTYAYFVTVDSTFAPVYPYIIGPCYWGLPTGLHYEYIDGINTPVYINGNYKMPTPQSISVASIVRSPDGSVSSDSTTLTQGVYANWNNNYTYVIDEIDVIHSGYGYINPIVTITSVDGNGGGATATAIADINTTGIISINVTNNGNGYTSTPMVIVSDANVSTQCQAYPRLLNETIRKITTTLRFDRVWNTKEFYNANIGYTNGSVVFDSVSNQYYQAVVNNPIANLHNTSNWVTASNSAISTSTAINRTSSLYAPTSDMPANNPSLLMSGLNYTGVYVTDDYMPNTYKVPSGPIHDQDDANLVVDSLNVTWDPGLLSDSAFSTQIAKFSDRSGQFNQNTSTYIQVDSANSTNLSNLALNSNEFTIEFFFRFSALEITTTNGTVEQANMVLLDTRESQTSTNGLLIFKTLDNELAFSVSNISNPIMIGGGITTNEWQFATIQRSANIFTLYVDGQLVDSYNYGNTAQPNFTDTGLTLGSDINAGNISNGFMDELRITANVLRYPINTQTIQVPAQAFPRSIYDDPYFTAQYTLLLYGFEGSINESPLIINFNSINSNTYLQDVSWNNKNILLVNYDLNKVIVDATPFNGIGQPVLTMTLNI